MVTLDTFRRRPYLSRYGAIAADLSSASTRAAKLARR